MTAPGGAPPGVIVVPYHGATPRIAPDAFVAPGVVLVGDVEIASQANVWFGCVLRGDTGPIRVGARANVQDMTMAHVDSADLPTVIGADVTIGHCVLLHACRLEDGAFVGMGATVMDGAVIEGGAMVAAGALVTPGKRVRKGELWSGSPARLMRELRTDDLANFRATVEHYVEKGADYRRVVAELCRD
jgi:carbonic anhydrase/acetyltransferase-like protein (isoleucine patch superfamily)